MAEFYFREEELNKLQNFYSNEKQKSMAIFGRRRIGKSELILHFIRNLNNAYYYQVNSLDYDASLNDFKNVIKNNEIDSILDSLNNFKDVFSYISNKNLFIIIDEFPFLAKKNEGISLEFQSIIDHFLGNNKLVLLGSNQSFMKSQIEDNSSPLYGRFDEILHLLPFSFNEVNQLFLNNDDAMNVYALTGGIVQYVMFFMNYSSVETAMDELYFNRNGRLFVECGNYLNQEFKDVTTYNLILRYLASNEKKASDIAVRAKVDTRAIYNYINKLEVLDIIEEVKNPLTNSREKRYHIKDLYLRFAYTFIEPNVSMISALGKKSKQYILNSKFDEYLGGIYEEIIKNNLYDYALNKIIPFMPVDVGKWWGNIQQNGTYIESEIDVVGINLKDVLVGECKYRTKKVGLKEYELLKLKSNFATKANQKVIYLLASKNGFSDDLLNLNDHQLILIEKTTPVKKHTIE